MDGIFLGIETYNNNIGRSAMPLFTDSWMVAGLKLRSLPALVFDGLRRAIIALMLTCATAYAAEQRVALVIGNSAYPAAPLKNPLNDARAIARQLNDLGFEVILRTNLSQKGMVAALREFGGRLREGGVALFYFSGHGMQVKGRNYLIPVDADIRAEDEVPYMSTDMAQVLDKLETARSRANFVILDACRNNPFIRTFRSVSVGLAQMDAPGGTLLAYATAPGSEARDGNEEFGTYTKHLLAHMAVPTLPVEVMFRRVREGVMAETAKRQVPWESSSLVGDFYFNPGGVEAAPPAPLHVSTPPPSAPAQTKGMPAPETKSQVALAAPQAPGTSPSRLPRAGDSWTYRLINELHETEVATVTVTVSDVDTKSVFESVAPVANSRNVLQRESPLDVRIVEHAATSGVNVVEFAPFLAASEDFPVGRKWRDVPGLYSVTSFDRWRVDAEVVARERIRVPAGEFDAFRVEVAAERPPPTDNNDRVTVTRIVLIAWYAPASKRVVKSVRQTYDQYNSRLDTDRYELVSLKIQ